jgi:hypothetical protein
MSIRIHDTEYTWIQSEFTPICYDLLPTISGLIISYVEFDRTHWVWGASITGAMPWEKGTAETGEEAKTLAVAALRKQMEAQ